MSKNKAGDFKPIGYYINGATQYEIQLSITCQLARYRATTRYVTRGNVVTNGRWQEVRYSKRDGYAYIIAANGRRLYLHKFVKIY